MKWAFCLVTTSSLMFLGCGGGAPADQPDTAPVSGTVTLDGSPLPNVSVSFQPAEGRPSSGVTDENGAYTLQYTADVSGAKIGEHTVTLTEAEGGGYDDSGASVETESKLPAAASDGSIKFTVSADGENNFPIELKSE